MEKILIPCCIVLLISVSAFADDPYEPNNTFGQAATLPGYGTYSLTAVDDDWFKIPNVNLGLLYLKLEHPTGSGLGDLNMILYNDNQQIIKAVFCNDCTEEFQYHVLNAGDYYIQVFKASPFDNTYTLTVSDSVSISGDDSNDDGAGNDSILMAVQLSGATVTVQNQKSYDDDWFKLNVLPGVFTVNLNFVPGDGNIDLAVYDSSFTGLAISFAPDPYSPNGRTLEINVPAEDTYYIRTIGESGNSYSLSTDLPTIWMTTLGYGPIRGVSVVLYDIDGDGKDEILVGTSKVLDGDLNEIRPAALVCLEDDGTVKWATEFPAISGPDPQTGKIYNTTSVSSTPAIGDIDGDGVVDIVVGVGADLLVAPGEKGGVYALNSDGTIKWYHQSYDIVEGGDGRPDGVFSSPVIIDIDNDGNNEVIFGGWDQYVWVLDGATGTNETGWPVGVLDTIGSSPAFADINKDGSPDILIGADITENPDAGTQTGGIFHVFDKDGNQNISGFDQFVATNQNYFTLKGKWEEQVLWSSPAVVDFDNDGQFEIAYGTGNYFQDTRGSYIRVWNHDGTEKFTLPTQGRTFASPLFGDLDGNGSLEIVTTTLDGYVYAWDSNGTELFGTQPDSNPIFGSPLAVDINEDGKLEILYAQGAKIIIVDSEGNQLTDPSKLEFVFNFFTGSPAVKDIDRDGQLDIISGGTNAAKDRAVVYRWRYGSSTTNANNYRYARRQFREPLATDLVITFVTRFYQEVLNRAPDQNGLNSWVNFLLNDTKTGADVGYGFVLSQEFINRGTSNGAFLTILYRAFFDRDPDAGGYNDWLSKLDNGFSREYVLSGFIASQEFVNLSNTYGITPYRTSPAPVEAFVIRFYQYVLSREPDQNGLNSWVDDLLNDIRTGADVGRGFVLSQEFINRNVINEEFLFILYRAFFNRAPDTGGYNYWLAELNSGTSREDVLDGFIYSAEFANLCSSYGITCY